MIFFFCNKDQYNVIKTSAVCCRAFEDYILELDRVELLSLSILNYRDLDHEPFILFNDC